MAKPDVIVVGGGAAGCVLAARLADRASVLLLEAGPDIRASAGELRAGWGIAPRESGWGFVSEPNPRGNTQNVWRTRALGGTSWLTRFAPRGGPADYDDWVARGNPGWSWDDVLPYFKRLEADREFGTDPWHGSAGPMAVSRYPERDYTPVAAAMIAAIDKLGFPSVDDHNRPGAVGVGRMPMSVVADKRVTTADAYLPEHPPETLSIRTDCQVAEVVFDGTRATGVRLLGGAVIEAGHVALCAGVYGNPPLLMRSGVGPADQLKAHGIPARIDLPGVGENLVDHPAVALEFGGEPSPSGPVLHFLATYNSAQHPDGAPPDMALWGGDPETAELELAVVLLKPRSRGRVALRSSDPSAAPVIELPALSDELDVERLREGYLLARRVVDDEAVRAASGVEPSPEPEQRDLAELIRDTAWSLPHVVGTCAMGTDPGAGAVVDWRGRVHGADGLTIADASIMPDVPSGFTHFPTIMLAERLAEIGF